MKASELRLNNWAWNDVQKIPVKVDVQIIQDQAYADKGLKESWKPIPLTEETLLKCGFEDVSSYRDFWLTIEGDLRIEISLRNNGIVFTSISDIGISENIKHLHQLQNLFHALTGEELEIEL